MIGIDIIDIARFEAFVAADHERWKRVFTEEEWKYCFSRPYPAQHLAGIFAAKEAVMKARGSRRLMGRFDMIGVIHDADGKPHVSFSTDESCAVAISISHNDTHAVAVALMGDTHGMAHS